MAIAIDYKVTFQDDLDANQTTSEFRLSKPWFKWGFRVFSIFVFVFGLYCLIAGITNPTDPDVNIAIVLGILFIPYGIILLWLLQPQSAQSSLERWSEKRKWKRKKSQEEIRKITVTDTEFIFATEYSELAWTRKAIKDFFAGEKGFLLWFYSGHKKYIPKRIFSNEEEIDQFRRMLEK